MSLGELIRKKRIESKLTQRQLGGKVGVSRVQVVRYENDEAIPRGGVLIKLQTELNIHPSEIIGDASAGSAQLVIPFDQVCELQVELQRKQPDSVEISIRVKQAS